MLSDERLREVEEELKYPGHSFTYMIEYLYDEVKALRKVAEVAENHHAPHDSHLRDALAEWKGKE